MGCSSSKAIDNGGVANAKDNKALAAAYSQDDEALLHSKVRADRPERLYRLLAKAQQISHQPSAERRLVYEKILEHCQQEPMAAKWKNPTTGSTPLHLACRLVDAETLNSDQTLFSELLQIIDTLIASDAGALRQVDAAQNIPLHYAIAPTTHFNPYGEEKDPSIAAATSADADETSGATTNDLYNSRYNWKERAIVVAHLIDGDRQAAVKYLEQNDVVYESGDATGGCTPLYRALQVLPDDFYAAAPTVDYIALLHTAYPYNAGKGNASDGDKPLSLLYRRFTRQFDISEQFFAGDNSRPQVVDHRLKYKMAAGNTWKLIELLLKPTNLPSPTSPWGIVHCAVQVETPPDLLRYIVETNAQDLTRVDPQGNLPLHYAAASQPPKVTSRHENNHHYPAFYTKYVMDELLYKFPEAAGMADAQGRYPLTLAVTACSGKQWIGGGIKSLYDAYPEALQQLQLEDHPSLRRALSMAEDGTLATNDDNTANELSFDEDGDKEDSKDEKFPGRMPKKLRGVVKDEHHDAIMLVQQTDVTVEEVTTSMWAHEEDAGVQMLGCIAIAKMLENQPPVEVLRIALTGTASVVNAMKAHPNELIVQEKACKALQGLAVADGHREVSMVASGAVAAIVGAMQAHVGDAGVQEQACRAVAAIVRKGGADRATVVASVSGVTAILNALAAHAQVVGVQVAGLLALEAMTQHPNANLPELPRAQTEPLLMSAQELFPKECSPLVAELMDRMAT